MRLSGLGCCAQQRRFHIPGGFGGVFVLIALTVILSAIFLAAHVIMRRRHLDEYEDLAMRTRLQPTPELKAYIGRALSVGYAQDQIEEHLRQLGWPQETVDAAFAEVLSRWLVAEEPREPGSR
jgi:hypothetical protein